MPKGTCWVLLAALAAGTEIAQAEKNDSSPAFDRFRLIVGGFLVDLDSETRVSSESLGAGTTINFEDDLGMDSSETVLFLGAEYRFARRHSIGLSYLNLDRDAFTPIGRTINFDGQTFPVNAAVETEFHYDFIGAIYRYSMIQTENADFRLLLGGQLH